MQLALSEILGRKKILLPSGRGAFPLAVLLDPRNGRILGIACDQGFLPIQDIIPREDVWEFRGKIKKAADGDNWLGFRVVNRKGLRRGKVTEIWFDDGGIQVSKLECRRKVLGMWRQTKIFSSDDIFEVLPTRRLIVVEEENRVFRRAEEALSELKKIPTVTPSGCTSS